MTIHVPSSRIINPSKLKSLPQAIANSRHQIQSKMAELFNLLEVSYAQQSDDPAPITLAGADGELIAQAEQNSLPCWVISHPAGTGQSPLIMYANEAALNANYKKAEDLIGEPYLQLWDPNSLRELVHVLWSPRAALREHQTRGFRFSSASPWDRIEHRFWANYRRVSFMGSPCWIEEILGAEPVN